MMSSTTKQDNFSPLDKYFEAVVRLEFQIQSRLSTFESIEKKEFSVLQSFNEDQRADLKSIDALIEVLFVVFSVQSGFDKLSESVKFN